jgi:cytochrome c oxidase subunit 1/cytochrome c oxidase subunit I+III
MRHGAAAGDNPWNADTLEWDTSSPPPSYGVKTLPLVASRHPLWDDHDESHDPDGERALDHSRLTFATTWLAARPAALSQMVEETLAPLVLMLVIAAWFAAVLLKLLWIAGALTLIGLAVTAWWLWPKPEKHAP